MRRERKNISSSSRLELLKSTIFFRITTNFLFFSLYLSLRYKFILWLSLWLNFWLSAFSPLFENFSTYFKFTASNSKDNLYFQPFSSIPFFSFSSLFDFLVKFILKFMIMAVILNHIHSFTFCFLLI